MKDNFYTGIFGGAFDPPHAAHVMAAAYSLCCLGVRRLLVIPCADHPFGKVMTPFQTRLRMATLAFECLGDRVEVLDIESHLPQPSYTINTVEAIQHRFPDARLALVIGSDNARTLDRWHRADELRRMVDVLVLDRGEGNGFVFPPVSSTMIRERIAQGLPVDGLVPGPVLGLINELGLYRGAE